MPLVKCPLRSQRTRDDTNPARHDPNRYSRPQSRRTPCGSTTAPVRFRTAANPPAPRTRRIWPWRTWTAMATWIYWRAIIRGFQALATSSGSMMAQVRLPNPPGPLVHLPDVPRGRQPAPRSVSDAGLRLVPHGADLGRGPDLRPRRRAVCPDRHARGRVVPVVPPGNRGAVRGALRAVHGTGVRNLRLLPRGHPRRRIRVDVLAVPLHERMDGGEGDERGGLRPQHDRLRVGGGARRGHVSELPSGPGAP